MSSKLRVLIDGLNLALPKGTGVATYARTLSQMLANMDAEVSVLYGLDIPEKEAASLLGEVLFFDRLGSSASSRKICFFSKAWWTKVLYCFSGWPANEIFIKQRVESRLFEERMPYFDHILNIPFLFQIAAGFFRKTGRFLEVNLSNPPDIAHWTYPVPIKITNAKNIYTLHDIVPLVMPSTTLDDKDFYYRLLDKIVRDADLICTISDSSKKDILGFFPEAKGKVYNTYQSSLFFKTNMLRPYADTSNEVERIFGFPDKGYFLFFGQLEPKKNVGRLIESFLASASERPLVLVGSNGWKEEDELRFLQMGVDSGRIFHIPYLPTAQLMMLIRHARAVLFPSISEGFGLPILEAFHLETPVLTSNIGALQEVAQEAAFLVDPYDPEDIRKGIELLDKDDGLCETLKGKGRKRAAFFNEKAYRERLMELYEQVL